ncbi:hypothetical protein CEB3_c19910 [Peptococcaceae bacterium CEB3]|nr:hypothetical protein CEB3_c19910 [Peptococcaceae bacterium CEB3]
MPLSRKASNKLDLRLVITQDSEGNATTILIDKFHLLPHLDSPRIPYVGYVRL